MKFWHKNLIALVKKLFQTMFYLNLYYLYSKQYYYYKCIHYFKQICISAHFSPIGFFIK